MLWRFTDVWSFTGVMEFRWCYGVLLVLWSFAGVIKFLKCYGVSQVLWSFTGVMEFRRCYGVLQVLWSSCICAEVCLFSRQYFVFTISRHVLMDIMERRSEQLLICSTHKH